MKLTNRRVRNSAISLILAVALVLVMVPAVSLKAGAYADVLALPGLTGDRAKDTVNIALSQLGYRESADGGTAYGAWWTSEVGGEYNYTYSGWCSMFACWSANKAGAGIGISCDSRSAQPDVLLEWLRANAWADTTLSIPPVAGDFIFFGYNGEADHVAIVVSYDATTNIVTFVGGNQSDAVTLSTVEWSTSGRYGNQRIVGYGRPNYGAKVSVPSQPSVVVERSVYITGAEVNTTWKKVPGTAYYSVELYRDGQLVAQDNMVDLPGYRLVAAEAGEYTIHVVAKNCAGASSVAKASFVVIDSMPNMPVWITDSTLEAAEVNAKLQSVKQGLIRYATWYTQTEWYALIQSQG